MKKILIVGATSTIAVACARLWASQGAIFFLVARNALKLSQTSNDLIFRGCKGVRYHVMDATSFECHQEMLDDSLSFLETIDIVLIAYGTLPEQLACEKNTNELVKEFTTNSTSVIALIALIANQMEHQRIGTIAVITSVAGERGRPSNYVYGSAKGAVSIFCDGLRARLFRSGVHLVDIRPGFVDTRMTRGLALPRLLVSDPQTVAERIVYGIERKKDVLYTPAFWKLIMLTIKLIPKFLFKRMSL